MGISSSKVNNISDPINIEHPEYTLLIGFPSAQRFYEDCHGPVGLAMTVVIGSWLRLYKQFDILEFGGESPLTMRARCSGFRYCPNPLGIVTAKRLDKLEFGCIPKI